MVAPSERKDSAKLEMCSAVFVIVCLFAKCLERVTVCNCINRSFFVSCMDIAVSSSVSVNDIHHIYQSFSRPPQSQ